MSTESEGIGIRNVLLAIAANVRPMEQEGIELGKRPREVTYASDEEHKSIKKECSDYNSHSKRKRGEEYDYDFTYSSQGEAEGKPYYYPDDKPEVLPKPVYYDGGDSLLEVFSVKISKPGRVTGQIRPNNNYGYMPLIYNLNDKEDCNDEYNVKEEWGDLLLTDYDEILETYDNSFIAVDLLHKSVNNVSKPLSSKLVEVSRIETKGFRTMHSCMQYYLFNKLRVHSIISDNRKVAAVIYAALLPDALRAVMEVKLLDRGASHGQSFSVFGSIKAANSMFSSEPNSASVLFFKDRKESVLVQGGQPIQLSRSKVAVPCFCDLIICVNLMVEEEDHFPSARITFPVVKGSGESVTVIGSRIQVKVTWVDT